MSKKKLSELSTQALIKKEKQYKICFAILVGLVVAMLIVLVGNIFQKDFDRGVLAFIPSVLFSIVIRYELQKIQKELKSRNLK